MHKKIFRALTYLIPFLLISVSLSLVFFGGNFSSQYKMDEIAFAQSNTVKSNKINYLGLYVEETAEGQLPDHEHEFYENYGVFRQERANYMSAVNVEKDVDVLFNEIDNVESLSMFYFGPIKSMPYKYQGKDVYKDFIYPFIYMFKSVKVYPPAPFKYVINISQTQADKLLGDKEKTEANYKSLLQTMITLTVNGDPYDFMIGNIFYETNYYYSAVRECLGEFVMVSYFYPKVLTRSNMYLFNEYEFQNTYFMDRILSLYSPSKYSLKVNHNNLSKPVDEKLITSFYYENISQQNWHATLMFVFSGVMSISSILFICIFLKLHKKMIWWIPIILSTLLPFAFFKLITKLSGKISLFASISTNINFYFSLSIILIYFIFAVVHIVKFKREKVSYEINI